MFKLMISFPQTKDLEQYGLIMVQPKEYLLSSASEVCNVITSLSHLKPLITLLEIDFVTAADVLKDFKVK